MTLWGFCGKLTLKAVNVAVTSASMIMTPTRPASDIGLPDAFSPIGITYVIPEHHEKPTLKELGLLPPPPFSETR